MQYRRSRRFVLPILLAVISSLLLMPCIGSASLKATSAKTNASLKANPSKPKKFVSSRKTKARRGKTRTPVAAPLAGQEGQAALGATCPPQTHLRDQAQEFLGVPYRAGGSSKNGTDCSGLTKQIFSRLYGVELPHSSAAQSRLPYMEEVSEGELQPGDLVFFGPGKKRINHVGVYLADGKFLHASRTVGVTVSELDDKYWQRRLITLKRPQGLDPADNREATENQNQGKSYYPGRGEIVTAFGPSASNDQRHVWSSLYRRDVLGESLDMRIGGFLEARAPMDDPVPFDADFGGRTSEPRREAARNWGVSQGMKLAAAIRPFSWLEVAPALSYRSALDTEGGQARAPYTPQVGIDALLAPVNSRWSLAMSTYRSTQDSAPESLSSGDRDGSSRAYDLSVGLRYRLSDDLLLSVMGSHDTSTSSYADSGPDSADVDKLAFRLDYRF